MGKNVSHVAATKQILFNRTNFNVCMNDKFLGTFFNYLIRLQAMAKLHFYLTKYEQTGFKSNDHTTGCCVNYYTINQLWLQKYFNTSTKFLVGRLNNKLRKIGAHTEHFSWVPSQK